MKKEKSVVPKTKKQPVLSRRGFIGLSGCAAATGVLAHSNDAEAFSLLPSEEIVVADKTVASVCEICFWRCGLIADVKGGHITSLKGHPQYPTSKGKLCGRGNAGIRSVTDSDRLKYPMVRTGKRGEGKFERVGWPTAYKIIAQNFEKIKKEYGAKALGLFYHCSSSKFIRSMMVAYGTPNYATPSFAQCKGPRNIAYKLTFGQKPPSHEPLDFEHTKCMVFFGSHLGENAHNSQVQEFVDALERGAKLIVLDPRFSIAASKAHIWLPVKPGSDLAIILAWIHLLIRDKSYDEDFVNKNAIGLEELAKHVRLTNPQWAAKQAGVSADDIIKSYQMMRDSMPSVVIHPGRHTAWYGEADTQRARGQAILTTLLGAWWRKGGIFRTKTIELETYPQPDYPDLPKSVDEQADRFPFAHEVTSTGIRDATITGDPYPIKGWYVHGFNAIHSMPSTRKTIEAIEKLDFMVVCDVMPTEITKYADVLLPEDSYLERYDDIMTGTTKTPYLGIRQPVVSSPYDTRPGWRIAKELGAELGVGDFFAFDTFEEYLEARLNGSGVTLAELKEKGVYIPPNKLPLYLADNEQYHFHTPSGKIELYSQRLKDKGFDPLPVYKAQPEPSKDAFRLLYGRSPLHSFSRTQNNELLFALVPDNKLWMSVERAKKLNLTNGDIVVLKNKDTVSSGSLMLKVTNRMPNSSVYTFHGFGQHSKDLSRGNGHGINDSEIIDDYTIDAIGGTNGMRTQFVTVHLADKYSKKAEA